jgi:hypothetical protein
VNTFSDKNKQQVICVAKNPDSGLIFLFWSYPSCVKLNDH